MSQFIFNPALAVAIAFSILLHDWEKDQLLLATGVEALAERLHSTPIPVPGAWPAGVHTHRSLADIGAVRLSTKVCSIERGQQHGQQHGGEGPGEGQQLWVQSQGVGLDAAEGPCWEPYDAVIVAATSSAMQHMGLCKESPQLSAAVPSAGKPCATIEGGLLSPKVRVALQRGNLISSSKLFIRTEKKFWKGTTGGSGSGSGADGGGAGTASCPVILTDGLARGFYCLDYPQTDNGVVCVSYTWGADSTKLLGLNDRERLHLFMQSIHDASPETAAQLVPLHDEVLSIDWDTEPGYHGAFKLNLPGQDSNQQAAYFQFQTCLREAEDTGVYLAGDSVSWSGGWVEGALQTGLNAACAAAHRCEVDVVGGSPLSQNDSLYKYN